MYIRSQYPNELYHHGIKGQRWGVRRFQKPNGTLTKAGEKRYQKRLSEKAVIIGGQSHFANARAENAKKRYDKMNKRAQKNPTDKNLQKVKERKQVYDALQKEANEWNKLTDKTIKEAKNNADRVRKTYGDVKLKKVPADRIEAGKMYKKRIQNVILASSFFGGPIIGSTAARSQMRNDQQVAEYFKKHQ